MRRSATACHAAGERRIMETKPSVPRAILVGVQIPSVDDVTHAASIEELGRLVKTLGYEVVGTISQKRDEISGGTVLGKGRLEELAAITAKHPWLVIACDSCGTVVDLDLRVKPRNP
jgi:GTP-binding protein HflX